MTDRDRLIELTTKAYKEWSNSTNHDISISEYCADYLLANGTFILPEDLRGTEDFSISAFIEAMQMYKEKDRYIKPPCKVGQTVYTNVAMRGWYFRTNDKPYRAEIVFMGINNSEEMGGGFINIAYENKGYMWRFNFADIGKTVFLTKEEAEKALAERK